MSDLRWNELAAVLPLVVMMVWIGLYPKPFLDRIEPSVQQLLIISGRGVEQKMLVAEKPPLPPDEAPADETTAGGAR